MKITCQQQSLSKALSIVSKGVTSRTTIPILKGILLEVEDYETMKLTASDLDLTIETRIQIKSDEIGSVVVFSRLFTDIIRKMPSGEIEIDVEDSYRLSIKCKNSEFDIVGLSSDEFPNINEMEETHMIVMDKETFKDMIRKTSFSASVEEARGILTGVLIEMDENEIKMIALDGFRMASVKNEIQSGDSKKIVISSKIINEINKILGDDDQEELLQISIESKRIIFLTGKIKVTARLMEGEYINYESIFPNEKRSTIRLSKDDLLESIERASLLAKEGKNNLIKMTVADGQIMITSRSDEGKVKEEILIEQEGPGLEIGFNSKYVMDVLKALTGEEEILMEFNTNVNPCVIKPSEGNHFKYLILPVRITS